MRRIGQHPGKSLLCSSHFNQLDHEFQSVTVGEGQGFFEKNRSILERRRIRCSTGHFRFHRLHQLRRILNRAAHRRQRVVQHHRLRLAFHDGLPRIVHFIVFDVGGGPSLFFLPPALLAPSPSTPPTHPPHPPPAV